MRRGTRLLTPLLAPYRAFFKLPDVTAMVLIAWLSRLPVGMIGLAMVMFMRESLGDFKIAGSVVGSYFVSMAVFAPALPGRCSTARASPEQSAKHATGWNPYPRL